MRGRRKQKKREEGGSKGSGGGGVEYVICVTLEELELSAQQTYRINPSYSHSCLCLSGQMRKGEERMRAGVCAAEFAVGGGGHLGRGLSLWTRPSGPPYARCRQGCSLLCSCPAQAWGGARPPRPPRLLSGCAEHKALSPSRSLSAEPDPPKRRICT
jgi:hypothetical protein